MTLAIFAVLPATAQSRRQSSPHQPPVAAKENVVSPRLSEVQRLLREAAAKLREEQIKPHDQPSAREAVAFAWTLHETVPRLLNSALMLPNTANDYSALVVAERDKGGHEMVPEVAARFVERVAERLTVDDLDESFVLPTSFRQFRETSEWPKPEAVSRLTARIEENNSEKSMPSTSAIRIEAYGTVTPPRLPSDVLSIRCKATERGLQFVLTNHAAEKLVGVKVVLQDVLWWHEPTQKFIETELFHGTKDGKFPRLLVQSVAQIFADKPVTCWFLQADAASSDGKLAGTPATKSQEMRNQIRRMGKFQALISVEDAAGRVRNEAVCFKLEPNSVPEWCACEEPKPASVTVAPRPPTPVRTGPLKL
jgi:hypothetical protein